jgi:[protein-PII] uridylyltransferase
VPTQIHREKVLAHAEQQLLAQGKLNSEELVELYRKFLKIENYRLRMLHHAGGGGREVCAMRASLMDVVLRHLLDAALTEDPKQKPPRLALVANGGYGRGELNPNSDLDIMFLHADSLRGFGPRLEEIVKRILYMLWDVGFKVGHATRSIAGAVREANDNMKSKTAFLESRLIAGDAKLFEDFKAAFMKRCVAGHEEQYIADRVANQAERHAKAGRSVYMQEPDIKNGCGGLRDYQNLLWISFFKERVQTTAELVKKGFINEAERRELDRAYDFLLRVRTELHYLNKRATDTIVLNQQLPIANKLGYNQKSILRRTEAFMRDYYRHARTIFFITQLLSERLSIPPPPEAKSGGLLGFLSRKPKPARAEHFDGFVARGGRLYAEAPTIFNQEPARMMRLFQHLQLRGLRMSAELAQLVRRRLHLVDRTFQYSKAARETFLAICSRKGQVGAILRAMHEVDFLGRYLPEFGQLTALVQHEFFHRYTADEHTLVCIEKLDALIDNADPKFKDYLALFQKLDDPAVLYLALLLHDTGKASSARHHSEASTVFAQKVARRLQLTPEQRRALLLLVDNHIVLSSTAQRRNLDDDATISEFATVVKSQGHLEALMLLTLADGQGTGDENWSDWKESLVWQLFRGTSLYLADGEAFYRQRTIEREGLRTTALRKLSADYREEIDAHFEFMPERYFQMYPIGEIVEHIRIFRQFLVARWSDDSRTLAPAVRWIPRPERGHSEFWFCGWDRAELLARIAGSLSTAGLNILSADVFTRGDSLVLDIFRVCSTDFKAVTDPRDIAAVEKRLHQSLEATGFDFDTHLAKARKKHALKLAFELDFPTRISVDNAAHPVYTLVDIQTPDRLGLLYDLLRAIGQSGAQIALSRIATEKGAAIDSFYITDAEGKKIRSENAIRKLHKALQRASEAAKAV